MQAKFRVFRGRFRTWQGLFEEAAEFASMIGRERLLNIAHSEENGLGVVTVRSWGEDGAVDRALHKEQT